MLKIRRRSCGLSLEKGRIYSLVSAYYSLIVVHTNIFQFHYFTIELREITRIDLFCFFQFEHFVGECKKVFLPTI